MNEEITKESHRALMGRQTSGNEGLFSNAVQDKKQYYLDTLAQLGLLPEEAGIYGFSVDAEGNVLQTARHFDGRPVKYLPARNRRKFERLQARKTMTDVDPEEVCFVPYQVKRHHPALLAGVGEQVLPRYLMPAGEATRALPTPAAIRAYREGKQGGTIFFIEGYKKAVALDRLGFEAVAFLGITHYKLDAAIREYLKVRKPARVVISYDGDALQHKSAAGKPRSRRVEDFRNSAARFAQQFFNLVEEAGLATTLHFQMVHPEAPEKGVDDLVHATGDRAGLCAELKTLDGKGAYFTSFRLYKTSCEQHLNEFFGLNLYRSFWKRFRHDIGEQTFVYKGAQYQAAHFGNLFNNHKQHFDLLTDPFRIGIPRMSLQIQRFLGELESTLTQLLDHQERVAIQAPTGAGKTTFFLDYAKRTRTRMVITVPTVLLARQLERANRRHCVALYGRVDFSKKEKALNAPIVVCTYDSLHHVSDLCNRLLVVDEAHNLVNQYGEVRHLYRPFRAETLRSLTETFESARKVVAISGTMPELLCKAFDFALVEVERLQNNVARIYQIEAEGARSNALTATLLSHLGKTDFSEDRIHFVYYNNTEELTYIRNYLVKKKRLRAEEIELITRYHYNCGENKIFHEIVQDARITTKVKLVLCTCLISEGVNINNTNIGRIYTVGVRCSDSFRQFIARFRKMAALDVFSIQGRERDLGPEFFLPAGIELMESIERGELQVNHIKRRKMEHDQELDPEELPYADQMEEAFRYDYHSEFFREVYFRDGRPRVDRLRILAGIRERMLGSANNCYFYSQLSRYPNIRIHAAEDYYVEDSIKDEIQAGKKEQKARQEEEEGALKEQLLSDPAHVVKAFHLYYHRAGNRHGTQFLRQVAPEMLKEGDETEARKVLTENKELFQRKWYRRTIRNFLQLRYIGCSPEMIREELNRPYQEFAARWQAFMTWGELSLYENKRRRKLLRAVHREDIRAKYFIDKHLAQSGQEIRLKDLQKQVQKIFHRKSYSRDFSLEVVEQLAVVTEAQVERLLKSLYQVKEVGGVGDKRFEILEKWDGQNVPFVEDGAQWLRCNWMKVRVLCSLSG